MFTCVHLQSGAIMTVLAAVCTKIPEGRLAIIFLPMFTFTAGNVSIFMKGSAGTVVIFLHWILALKLEMSMLEESKLYQFYSLLLSGPKSHYCHGYSRNDPGMEIFWSCSTSWGSSLWNVSLSITDCYTAFLGPLPPPTLGRQSKAVNSEMGAGSDGGERVRKLVHGFLWPCPVSPCEVEGEEQQSCPSLSHL